MDNLHKKIIEYFSKQSKGVIKLTEAHAKHLVTMVENKAFATAKLYKKDYQNNSWILYRTYKTTDEKINKVLEKLKTQQPNFDFYKWDIYMEDGSAAGTIFTYDQFLF